MSESSLNTAELETQPSVVSVARLGDAMLAAFGRVEQIAGHDSRTFSWPDESGRSFTLRQDSLLHRDSQWQDTIRVSVVEAGDSQGVELWLDPTRGSYGVSAGSNITAFNRLNAGGILQQLESSLLDVAVPSMYGYCLEQFADVPTRGAQSLLNRSKEYFSGPWNCRVELFGAGSKISKSFVLAKLVRGDLSRHQNQTSTFDISSGGLEPVLVATTEDALRSKSDQVAHLLAVLAGDSFVDRERRREDLRRQAESKLAEQRRLERIAPRDDVEELERLATILTRADELRPYRTVVPMRTILRFMDRITLGGHQSDHPHAIVVEVSSFAVEYEAVGLGEPGSTTGHRIQGRLEFRSGVAWSKESGGNKNEERQGEAAAHWFYTVLWALRLGVSLGLVDQLPEEQWTHFLSYPARSMGRKAALANSKESGGVEL